MVYRISSRDCKEWHKSEDGLEWHKQQSIKSWENREYKMYVKNVVKNMKLDIVVYLNSAIKIVNKEIELKIKINS
jgi:hypothetical protein